MMAEITPLPRFYSPEEFAAILGVAQPTVRRWAREGTIQAFRLGNTIRIPATELQVSGALQGAVERHPAGGSK